MTPSDHALVVVWQRGFAAPPGVITTCTDDVRDPQTNLSKYVWKCVLCGGVNIAKDELQSMELAVGVGAIKGGAVEGQCR